MMKIEGSGSASGSISQRQGSADPDPDPHQNVMDPQYWLFFFQLIWLLPRISSTRSLSLVGLEYGCQASALNMMPCPNLLELDLR